MSAHAGIPHYRSPANALENMRPRFGVWTGHRDGRSRTGRNAARLGSGDVERIRAAGRRAGARASRRTARLRAGYVRQIRAAGHVADVRPRGNVARFRAAGIGPIRARVATGVSPDAFALLRPIVGTISRIGTRTGSPGTLRPVGFVPAVFASGVWPRVVAAELLTQHRIPIGNAAAVPGIMLPATRRAVYVARAGPVVVVVDVHDTGVAMRPVQGAQEKTHAQRDPPAPEKNCAEYLTLAVAGPS